MLSLLPGRLDVIYNSGFPLGLNDGAVWAGRGVTAAISGGVSLNYGRFEATIAPAVFAAQNSPFPLRATGHAGARAFGNPVWPESIDLPQRFGDDPYYVLDPGQSEVRVEIGGAALGLSSANQYWGPTTDHPIVLGNNAAGIPRIFLGTSAPLTLWRMGRVHGQLFWGRAGESRHSPLADSLFARLVSGIVAVYQPRFLPGAEVGGGRFFHVLQRNWQLDGTELTRPFGLLLRSSFQKQQDAIARRDNQVASMFFRYTSTGDGMEFYGEYGREDHSNTLRELLLLPDHDAAYVVGMRKVWKGTRRATSLRAEVLNSRIGHLALSSQQTPLYIHGAVKQGHTHHGQALGSAAAHGGGASVLALERYTNKGRVTLKWQRLHIDQDGLPGRPSDTFGSDIQNVFGVERLQFGKRADFLIGAAAVYEINRQGRDDATALQVKLSLLPRLLKALPGVPE